MVTPRTWTRDKALCSLVTTANRVHAQKGTDSNHHFQNQILVPFQTVFKHFTISNQVVSTIYKHFNQLFLNHFNQLLLNHFNQLFLNHFEHYFKPFHNCFQTYTSSMHCTSDSCARHQPSCELHMPSIGTLHNTLRPQ